MRNLAAVALALAAACSHVDAKLATHDAAGCLAACPGATVVETSPNGAMCRCWKHGSGVQYTFDFPDSNEKLEYSRARWQHSLGIVAGCKLQGLGWESTPDGNDIQCATVAGQLKNTNRWTVR